jgi:hypothetical protein
MKVIKSANNGGIFLKMFEYLHSQQSEICVWQIDPQTHERAKYYTFLISYDLLNRRLSFSSPEKMSFNLHEPIFFYAEDGQVIFKTMIKNATDKILEVLSPEELKILEEAEESTMDDDAKMAASMLKSMSDRTQRDQDFLQQEIEGLSIEDEEMIFADQRESPRARPKAEKLVKIQKISTKTFYVFKLFDLSRGGISFVSVQPEVFPVGQLIKITGFDVFDLDDPLFARVMSHRPLDEYKIEYKIGCKFEEGQG